MSNISVDYDVLNQKGSPAWYSDVYANIPTAGYKGRMFISTDTYAFYRDTGTGWDLIGGPGTGTITGSGVSGQVSFFNGTQTLAGSNNLFWDNTNGRLGIGTATPGQSLDIHASGTNATFNGIGTSNAFLVFQNAGSSKWSIGNIYNAGANTFNIYNNGLTASALSISSTTNNVTLTGNVTASTYYSSAGIFLSTGGQASAGGGYATINGGTNYLDFRPANGGIFLFSFPYNTTRTFTLPDTTGTLALTSNLSSYVPYTGASGAVNLGAYNLTINSIILGAGAGSGSNNVSIGTGMTNNSTGSSNTSLGNSALGGNTTGSFNTGLGQGSMQANQSGNLNTAIGQGSLLTNTGGSYNTALGATALNLATGSYNTAIGQGAGALISTGTNNILIGYQTGNAITTGSNNTIIGNYVGNTTLSNVVLLADGAGTIRYQWDGTANTFTGFVKVNSVPISTYGLQVNNSLGNPGFVAYQNSDSSYALQIATTGATTINLNSNASASYINTAGNFGLGTASPSYKLDVSGSIRTTANLNMTGTSSQIVQTISNSVAGDNVAILYNSNANSYGLYIGAGSGTNHALYITDSTRSNNLFKVQGDGKVGIGTGSPSYTLEISANAATWATRIYNASSTGNGLIISTSTTSRTYMAFGVYNGSGYLIQVQGDGLIYTGTSAYSPYNNTTSSAANMYVFSDGSVGRSTSSLKYKKNIQSYNKGLNEVLKLRPVTYEGKSEMDLGKTFAGLIAEEVNELGLTEFVTYAEDGSPDALAYSNMIALLTKAIQELNNKLVRNNIN